MVSKLPQEFRRYQRNRNQLRHIFKETQRVLEVITVENFFPEEDIIEELLPSLTSSRLNYILYNDPTLIICGQDSKAKAALVNNLLSSDVLPLCDGHWRWIKLGYGRANRVSLTLGLEYEVLDRPTDNEKSWRTVSVDDLTKSLNEDANCPTIVEVKLDNEILKDGVQIFVVPDVGAIKILSKGTFDVLPIFLYALSEYPLTDENTEELRELRETYPYIPVLFVSSLANISFDAVDAGLTESEQHRLQAQTYVKNSDPAKDDEGVDIDEINSLGLAWLEQLDGLGFLRIEETIDPEPATWFVAGNSSNSSELIDSCQKIDRALYFVRGCLQSYLVNASNLLNDSHTTSLRKFILSAFDMAREIQITPRRIQYAQQKENELYVNLMNVVSKNQEDLTILIQDIIQEMKDDLQSENIDPYQCISDLFDDNERNESTTTVRTATTEVQRIVLGRLSDLVARQLVTSVNCLRETFVGTLQRCLDSLEKSYEHDVCPLASDALKQILSAAYNVELHNSSPSIVHSFLERIRRLVKSLPLPWSPTPTLNAAWRRRVTLDVLNSLSAVRLARTISAQFREKIKSSHDGFHAALRSLENHHSGKLERTEEQRVAIRKIHAPRLAKLALESTSMSDIVRFGIPHQGKEIGRGQYGVVFSCDGWGGAPGPCAVKSVVPPDEKHWNDLAMEFYYTRSIPDHKRIVKLRGSVIDHSYGGGCGIGAAVLLITDRMSRDLYCGIRAGLTWFERIQIAIDVLEGIRYLHSQGLLHRDIKLKNVLLDTENRAKLTDLGFCITEAMMSGSVVGTPVHMAPELLSGHYDSTVDIYAFGILFWYICAGHVKMPYAFEQFNNKEQLWFSVRRGLRPERLSHFDDECWKLMEQCWAGEPARRPLLGAILPVLESVRERAEIGKSITVPDGFEPREEDSPTCCELKSPVLALAEPNNQRGATSNPHPRRRTPRNVKRPVLHMTNMFQTSMIILAARNSEDDVPRPKNSGNEKPQRFSTITTSRPHWNEKNYRHRISSIDASTTRAFPGAVSATPALLSPLPLLLLLLLYILYTPTSLFRPKKKKKTKKKKEKRERRETKEKNIFFSVPRDPGSRGCLRTGDTGLPLFTARSPRPSPTNSRSVRVVFRRGIDCHAGVFFRYFARPRLRRFWPYFLLFFIFSPTKRGSNAFFRCCCSSYERCTVRTWRRTYLTRTRSRAEFNWRTTVTEDTPLIGRCHGLSRANDYQITVEHEGP